MCSDMPGSGAFLLYIAHDSVLLQAGEKAWARGYSISTQWSV